MTTASAAALAFAVVLGAVVRALPFIGTAFPLNDGGLFFVMTEELQASGYVLPEFSAYNGQDIPFVYSPLAFYGLAALNDLSGIPLLELFRYVPLALSVAMIPAFFVVARQLVSPMETAIATLAFALLPRSWEWMVLGGGVTRSLGFLLALVTIAASIRMYRNGGGWIAVTGVGAGLTALAHPQAAVFAGVSFLVLLAGVNRSWQGFRTLAVAAALGFVVIAPWLALMVSRHGFEPFVSARATGGGMLLGVILLLKLRFTGAPFMDVLGIIGFGGFAVALAQRRWIAPMWLVAVPLVDSRGGATYAMVPLALLVGIAIVAGLRAMNVQFDAQRPIRFVRRQPGVAVALLLGLVAAVATNQGMLAKDDTPLVSLTAEQRAAMRWAAGSLPSDASFAVVTGNRAWETDRISEWFPALTRQKSVATSQGFEWLGVNRWRAQLELYHDLQECSRQTAECLRDWSQQHRVAADYVFVAKGHTRDPQGPVDCCPALRATLRARADVVYDGPGATIAVMPSA